MLRIVKETDQYKIVAASDGLVADSIRSDTKFTLIAPDVSGKPVHLGWVHDGTHMQGLIKFLDLLGIHVEEANRGEIVEVFDEMQPDKTILQDAGGDNIPYASARFLQRLQAYGEVITPPSFSMVGGGREITLWTADLWAGKLERWVISEDGEGKRRIESKEM